MYNLEEVEYFKIKYNRRFIIRSTMKERERIIDGYYDGERVIFKGYYVEEIQLEISLRITLKREGIIICIIIIRKNYE